MGNFRVNLDFDIRIYKIHIKGEKMEKVVSSVALSLVLGFSTALASGSTGTIGKNETSVQGDADEIIKEYKAACEKKDFNACLSAAGM